MILVIDSYDSFTNNLAQLISASTGKEVTKIHNDTFKPDQYDYFLKTYLPLFEYIVVGPGPGHPENAEDIGIIRYLFQEFRENASIVVPVLGICLGFQSLCHEFGNNVSKLDAVKHGQIYDIHPMAIDGGNELYTGQEETSFPSVRYHSLYVDIHNLSEVIIPLAYCYEPNDGPNRIHTRILMAAKHENLPLYGVQYHPESICSSKGIELIKNFELIATKYNKQVRPNVFKLSNNASKEDFAKLNKHALHDMLLISQGKLSYSSSVKPKVSMKKLKFSPGADGYKISATDICDYFHQQDSDFLLLNSASIPGEWSIIGIPIIGQSEVVTHSVDVANEVRVLKYKSDAFDSLLLEEPQSVWTFIGDRMKDSYIPRSVINDCLQELPSRDLPFLGGYLGLISYEEGQHVIIEKLQSLCNSSTPDMKLVFTERFIIYDHMNDEWYIGSINQKSDDSKWCSELHDELLEAHEKGLLRIDLDTIPDSIKELSNKSDKDEIVFDFPSRETYEKQFDQCQDYLHSGDSYELCLTTQLKITLPSYINPWDMYKILTLRKNPSPFSCFMEFEDIVLISSSPERFLSWKDNERKNKLIELRPIKGTVKNSPDVDLEAATKILKTPKEMGENLMIVDLIRHDLHQFIENVSVTQLMAVEEYKTVYQLVSVIQGELNNTEYHGIDILHHSLPPGSMTGAPKKRSVELLQSIESLQKNGTQDGRRGIYSGVTGYWSVTDDSDWSVVIRSVYHYRDDKENQNHTGLWRIGAGGAITVLSDPVDEWDEMKLKLSSALQAFK